MKILIVSDILEWAIGSLSNIIRDENPNIKIKVIAIHPKDLRRDQEKWKARFQKELDEFNPSLVHFQYWDHVQYLAPLVKCKKILTHHNQKNLNGDWKSLDALVCHTKKAQEILEKQGYTAHIIQHGIDIEHFKFKEEYEENRMIGYVGRIVPWKGLYEILKVAKDFDSEVLMMGRIDKADYWHKCQEFSEQMDIRFGTSYEDQPKVYHEMGVYIGNSCENIEEGTLPLLEAMACGIPVITTPSGEAKDIIIDGVNGLLVDFENEESLRKALGYFYSMTKKEKDEMRNKAWDTVRHLSKQKMAYQYSKLYNSIIYGKDIASVVIPTYNRADTITKILDAYAEQTYPVEIIVSDDNSTDNTEEVVMEWTKNNDTPTKYIKNKTDGYGLAQARNEGIMNASGHYIVFNDDRLLPEKTAVEEFVKRVSGYKELVAVWGNKGAGKRDFLENFFCIRKKHIVQAGMFNERINQYGGQSQEIRERLKNQGFRLEYEPCAKSSPLFGTRKSKRRYDIFHSKLKLWKLSN
jgi:glycosyltransferase involved in cell wall biosynthesis